MIHNLIQNHIVYKTRFSSNNYSDYIYHYTDAESAFNILCDGFIKPYFFDPNTMETNKNIVFTKVQPDKSDVILIKNIYDLYTNYIAKGDIRSHFAKIQYVFGFKVNELESKLVKLSNKNDIWKYKDKINLKDFKFVLVVRKFEFEFSSDYEEYCKEEFIIPF